VSDAHSCPVAPVAVHISQPEIFNFVYPITVTGALVHVCLSGGTSPYTITSVQYRSTAVASWGTIVATGTPSGAYCWDFTFDQSGQYRFYANDNKGCGPVVSTPVVVTNFGYTYKCGTDCYSCNLGFSAVSSCTTANPSTSCLNGLVSSRQLVKAGSDIRLGQSANTCSLGSCTTMVDLGANCLTKCISTTCPNKKALSNIRIISLGPNMCQSWYEAPNFPTQLTC
jgi:hypothetical protein